MSADETQFLAVGEGAHKRRIAYRRRAGVGPGVVWLGGFKSDMASTKAAHLDVWCAERGRAFLRFDYSGHGESEGAFEDGTISAWSEESLTAIRALTQGPQILVGSSMGGWITLLVVRALSAAEQASRLRGLVLIAPAVDFTEALMWARMSPDARHAIETEGRWLRPSAYSSEPYAITRAFIADGRRNLLLGGPIRTFAPTRILQGMRDPDVPHEHALRVVERIAEDPVVLTLVRDGEHRMSRPQDLDLLTRAIEDLS